VRVEDGRSARDLELDEVLEETFPASDAPANTVGTGTRVGPVPLAQAVTDNPEASRFELVVDGQTAVLTYDRTPTSLVLVHTEAPPSLRGRHLADAQNRYTYFLVRGDGKFLVKRRVAGDSTAEVTQGWTESDAVVKADSAGQATNELSVLVRGGKVSFLVNGKTVYSAAAAGLDTQGIAGFRVNHNLDVHLSALGIHKL